MSAPDPDTVPPDVLSAVRADPGGFRTIGWVLVGLGLLAVLFPLASSVAFKAPIGWFFMLTGAALLWLAFQARAWRPALLSGVIGVLNLAVGVYLAFFLLTGLVGLTVLMALSFLIQGGMELAIALQNRDTTGWRWLLFSAVASGVLGLLLLTGLPGSALWAIGLFMGINLLTTGLGFLALVRAAAGPK